MSYRSWLEEVTSVTQIDCERLLIDDDAENWIELDDACNAKWIEMIRRPAPVADEYRDYFNTRLHDSWILGYSISEGKLELRLDNIYGAIFAESIAMLLNEPLPKGPFPVTLYAHDCRFARWAWSDNQGLLHTVEPKFAKKRNRDDQFLYDWFYERDGRIQWVCEAGYVRSKKDYPGCYLLVDCGSLSAEDRCAEAIGELYGPRAMELWNIARKAKEDIWAIGLMPQYVERVMEERGIGLDEFRTWRSR